MICGLWFSGRAENMTGRGLHGIPLYCHEVHLNWEHNSTWPSVFHKRCLFLAGSTTVPLDCDLMHWSSPPVRPQLHLRTICLAQLLLVVSGMVCSCCWPVLLLFFIHFLHINLFVYIMFLAGSAAVPHTFSSHHSPCIHHVSSRFYGCSSYIFFTSISLYTSCF